MENERRSSIVARNPNEDVIKNQTAIPIDEEILFESFSYDGYQVVRGEFFSHLYEPSMTFNSNKVYLNTACLRKLPEVNYVQILINPEEKKLAVRPSNEDAKDSFLWCSTRSTRRRPKYITCHIFFAKVFQLMGWNPNYRYKLLGKLIKSGDDFLFIFDLTATEIYQHVMKNEKQKSSRIPIFPAEWQNQFGLPVDEHRKLLQVNIFKGYTVFGVKNNEPADTPIINSIENELKGVQL